MTARAPQPVVDKVLTQDAIIGAADPRTTDLAAVVAQCWQCDPHDLTWTRTATDEQLRAAIAANRTDYRPDASTGYHAADGTRWPSKAAHDFAHRFDQ